MHLHKKNRLSVEWMVFSLQNVVLNPYRVSDLGCHNSQRPIKAHKKTQRQTVVAFLMSFHTNFSKCFSTGFLASPPQEL